MISSSPIVAAFERQRQLQPELIDVVSDHEDENGGPEAQVLEGDVPQKRKRSLQQVSTVRDRMKIIQWMINDKTENGEKGIILRTIEKFPMAFRGTYNANHVKATRWWKSRVHVVELENQVKSISSLQPSLRKVLIVKAGPGRGRRRSEWVEHVYDLLLEEFCRLKAAAVKFSPGLLIVVARDIITTNPGIFNATYVDPWDQKCIIDKIKTRWIQQFMVSRVLFLLV